ncbi:MAG TPA: toll/interleukin-1 receptor domain-containing protein [Candidatus Acidoferrum sp.]|nr:toll/interleukin-1 receptor domain-containing protein [Candidatus Acidoferrum sp.]
MSSRQVPEKFLVAFSFAGEQRDLVRAIAEAVEERLGRGTVFLDEWYEFYIAGDDADLRLQEIYGQKSELAVVCVSGNYGGKPWTLAEHAAIRARVMTLRTSPNDQDAYRVLPLRVGDGDVKGLAFNTISPDARQKPRGETAELIISRLKLIRPDVGRALEAAATQDVTRLVYLAECTPDLEDATKPINHDRTKVFLEDLGWTVLPRAEYPQDEYASRLKQDLEQCQAFVQLLGPYPWKRGGFDRLQNEAAVTAGLKRFRYRSSEIDLAKVEPAEHRQFLSAPDIIFTGFDDFLVHLESELETLGRRDDASRAGNQPLVRVAVRSTDPDRLWEQVFQWIYVQENILSDQLGPGESFVSKQEGDPCHGFLVVCDAAALDDGPLSPRDDLQQCRLIQIREKNSARRPPVAVVYWPPPSPSWSKLLRSTPLKLRYMRADSVSDGASPPLLSEFFAEVRRVAG